MRELNQVALPGGWRGERVPQPETWPPSFLPGLGSVGPRKTVRGLKQHATLGEGGAGGCFKVGTLRVQA